MANLSNDLRYGMRMLAKNPGVTLMAVLCLALGIGANTAIFSIVDAALLKPLPYKDPDRLLILWEKPPGSSRNAVSAANFLDWQNQNQVFEQMAARSGAQYNLSGLDQPEEIQGTRVSYNYFDLMGVRPGLGRTFVAEENVPGNDKVAVITHRFFQRRFGGDPRLVGSDITLNGEKYTVVGVLMPGSNFDRGWADIYTPLTFDAAQTTRDFHFLNVFARLKQGVTIEQAQADMDSIAAGISEQFPKSNKGWGITLDLLRDRIIGRSTRQYMMILLGAVGFILLIACANVANLSLARGASRQKEVAIRAALGAGRLRLVRQFLTESVLLALIGGALGVGLGYLLMSLLLKLAPPFSLPSEANVAIDLRVLLFALAISLITGVIFGTAPALQAAKPDLVESLKEGGRGTSAGSSRHRLRQVLVVAEISLALMLLIGAGLLVRSLIRLQEVSPGFQTRGLLTMRLSLPDKKYTSTEQIQSFYRNTLERVQSLPGVQSASLSQTLPVLGWYFGMPFTIEGQPPKDPSQRSAVNYQIISADYFRTLGIPLLRGRTFTEQDARGAPPVAVVNQTFVTRFLADEDPIGKRVVIESLLPGKTELGPSIAWQIVGVTGNVKDSGLDEEESPEVYVPYLQNVWGTTMLAVRTQGDPLQLANPVQGEIHALDKDQPVTDVKTMEQIISESVSNQRFGTTLLSWFAAVALALAAVGIYGVISFSVTQRTHEIGIRMALGASSTDVLRMVVGQGVTLALVGVAVGVGAAFALTRLMASMLFGITATDPLTFALTSALLFAVALLACYVPARRATRVDPMIALRYE